MVRTFRFIIHCYRYLLNICQFNTSFCGFIEQTLSALCWKNVYQIYTDYTNYLFFVSVVIIC